MKLRKLFSQEKGITLIGVVLLILAIGIIAFIAGDALGQAFLILAFSTDTAVSGVILALLVIVSKKYGTSDIGKIVELMQQKNETEVDEQ